MSGQPCWHWPTPLLMQTLAKKCRAMHRAGGGQMQRGARGACSHCVPRTKTGTEPGQMGRPAARERGEPLCPAPAPRILHLISPYNFVPRLMVRGIFLNICNGRQSRDAESHWSRRTQSHRLSCVTYVIRSYFQG